MAVPSVYGQSRYSASEGRTFLEQGIEIEREAAGDIAKLEDALEAYEEAVARDADLMPAWARIGYVLYALGRYEEAVERLSAAADRSSDNVEVRQYLGINLYQLGREDEAAEVLAEVLAVRDDLPEALFILGKYHLERRQDDQALPLFERYRALEPEDLQVYRALATIHLRARELGAARDVLDQTLERVPADGSGHITRGHPEYAEATTRSPSSVTRRRCRSTPTV